MRKLTQAEAGAVRDIQAAKVNAFMRTGDTGKPIIARIMRIACCGRKRAKTLVAYANGQI